jgi:hypothetical protein
VRAGSPRSRYRLCGAASSAPSTGCSKTKTVTGARTSCPHRNDFNRFGTPACAGCSTRRLLERGRPARIGVCLSRFYSLTVLTSNRESLGKDTVLQVFITLAPSA